MIGKTIGNYQIQEKIGAGGMGEVFRAHDTRLDRDVAVKVLPDSFAGDPERLSRFEREAKLLAGLNHTNIGAIYGIEEADGARFLILELIDGEDLSKRLQRGAIPVDEALEIASQIAEALEAAHEQGVIHRDLKPANIQLTPDGQVKVLDFGLAKALDSGGADSAPDLTHSPTLMASSPTAAGVILGTAPYMSPEQARGRRVDKRSDIFAFGTVLYEMLTGTQLFIGETVSDTLAAVLREEVSLERLPGGTPPALRALVGRCLEKNPKRRVRDIGEARIVIEDIRSGKTPAEESGKPPARPGWFLPYGGWVATGVVVVVALFAMMKTARSPTTDLPLRKSTIPLNADDPSRSLAFDPAISPDGRYVAYVSEDQLWVRDLTAVESRPFDGTESAVQPFWSPDSEWIGFGKEGTLQKVSRQGGRPVPIGNFPAGLRLGASARAAWTPDGRIVIGPATAGLQTVPAQGGEMTSFLPTGENETDFHEIAALPDGKGWVFVIHDADGLGNLDVLLPDKSRRALLRLDDGIGGPSYSPSGHIVFSRFGTTRGIWAIPFSLSSLERTGEPFLVAAGGRHPSVATDGTLVYSRGVQAQQAQLAWFDRTGAEIATVGREFTTSRPFPSLSPDDRSILLAVTFGDGREMYVFDVASGNDRRLTFNNEREDIGTWHPDGKTVYFYDNNRYTMHTLSLDGTHEARSHENGIMARSTPDGSQLVFCRQKPNEWDWDIFGMPIDGEVEDARELVATSGVDWWPIVSPNGRYLLYVSNETGEDEVYATTFPNAGTRWQVSSNGGAWPAWRSDGREIYYTTRAAIMVVDVETEAGLTLGTPVKLFDRPSINWSSRWVDGFDATNDGQRFIMLRHVPSKSDVQPEIVVTQNWFAEFE